MYERTEPMPTKFDSDTARAPKDKFVLLKVCSGMTTTPFDYVMCRKHSDGYKDGCWVTAQNDRLTDSHTGEVLGWNDLLNIDPDAAPQ
jgi:hypothetical protein